MKILAGIIGFGIGKKHFESIENYKGSKVKVICEKNGKLINELRKKLIRLSLILKKKFLKIRISI